MNESRSKTSDSASVLQHPAVASVRFSVAAIRLVVVWDHLVVAAGRSVIATGRSVIATGRSVIATGRSVVAAGRSGIATGRSVVAAGRSVVAAGRSGIATGRSVVATGRSVVATGQAVAHRPGLLFHVSGESKRTANHALQRTGAAVTPAASCLRLSPAAQRSRQPRRSLSLGSLGVARVLRGTEASESKSIRIAPHV